MVKFDKVILAIKGRDVKIHRSAPIYEWSRYEYYLGSVVFDNQEKRIDFNGASIIPRGIPILKEFTLNIKDISIC